MKSATTGEHIKDRKPAEKSRQSRALPLQQQVVRYQKEKDILLTLSNDITRVREKDDLIKVFSSGLKAYFYFTHTVISLMDKQKGTYFPFLIDRGSMQIRHRSELPSLLKMQFLINDPFLSRVSDQDVSASFLLEEIINEPGIPAFLKVNYECGIRKAMIVKLKSRMETIGHVLMYSDRTDSFPDDFKNVLEGIAPHLSNAVANIIINEEIAEKDKDKTFLIAFSHDIASARTRDDLSGVIHQSLKKLGRIRAYFIRTINDDGVNLSPFMHDRDVHYIDDPGFKKLLNTRIKKNEGLTGRVLRGTAPLLVDFAEEIKQGNTDHYIAFWKGLGEQKAAFQKMVGVPLRAGSTDLGVLWVITEQINLDLLKGISDQIAVAVSNILANEQIIKKHSEQTFLLDFSNDIARVRTKPELQAAIFKVLDKTMHAQLAMIRVIEEDNFTLRPFMYDSSLFQKAKAGFDDLAAQQITIEEPYTARVLAGSDGVVFNVDEELKSGNAYARLWKTAGLKRMYSFPLRVGNKNLGTIWLLADRLSNLLLKGICAQISVAIANIQANEKLLAYKKQLEVENDYLKEQIETICNFSDIIGDGPEMQKVYHLMSLVAESNATVLLLGETGTGKELIARAIHNASPRKGRLMVKVNCAALPVNLIESELFGHEKGSFTGAVERRIGKFEMANNSTLFLDEIGEMPLETQVKLLRVLQERELERVGGKTTIKVDVRIIAATNRNLEHEVRSGRFRSDLYYRLNVFPVTLPPLRERREDIAALAAFFLERYSKNAGKKMTAIAPQCIAELKRYTWPGNVRELEHLIERSILLTQGNVLTEIQLPKGVSEEGTVKPDASNKTLQELERTYIIEVLKRCSGKIAGNGGAAAALEMPSTTLHSKMKKLGISKGDYFQN
ncbi:MAG TPA: sigma 54-interacting transcriptional regulator [Agriterribacter sp.]|nr:sigma 54-interacting transcriptional regulator [Agriterribacter sp.]